MQHYLPHSVPAFERTIVAVLLMVAMAATACYDPCSGAICDPGLTVTFDNRLDEDVKIVPVPSEWEAEQIRLSLSEEKEYIIEVIPAKSVKETRLLAIQLTKTQAITIDTQRKVVERMLPVDQLKAANGEFLYIIE